MHAASRWFGTFVLLATVIVGPASAVGRSPGDVPPDVGAVVDEGAGATPVETERGREALGAASRMKREAYALEGEAREQALLAAASAYGAVADQGDHGVLDRVEGAFRAGEILRARGLGEEAGRRFAQAVGLGEPAADPDVREFAARALLERAHRIRREGEATEALAAYGEVRGRFADRARPCSHAVTWSGKLLLAEGRVDEARDVLLDLEPFLPGRELEAVRNVDRLVEALLEAGRTEEAHEAVARVGDRMAAAAAEEGETMTAALEASLGALRDKVGHSGY